MIKKTLLAVLLGTLTCASVMAAAPPTLAQGSVAAVAETTKAAPPSDVEQQARRQPRDPGGSGCDDPGDVAENPECGGANAPIIQDEQQARRKPRDPGGSGCDDPGDVAEHPECRPNAIEIKRQI